MDIISAEHIVKTYSGHVALNDLTLNVPERSIYGLLGPNGAGKTSFIRIINQITAPDSGKLLFHGKPIQASDVARIGYLPEERGLYKKMRVGEQALYLAQLKGLSSSEAKKKLAYWFEKFDIHGWWDKRIEELSKGMAQKVQFITTVLHEPELLIFDEPFTGFDPINTNLIKKEIRELRDKGATVIFSTHRMESVEEICDHIALINKSNKILEGPLKEIRMKYRTNTYSITFEPREADLLKALPHNYHLVDHHRDNEGWRTARITLEDQSSPNEILEYFIQRTTVHHFEEVIPSVNDIFIREVQKN